MFSYCPPPPRGSARGGARPRWASRHKWLTKTRNEPQGGARVRKDGLLRFQARSAQLERATKLAARIGWELSVFSSLFSTGRDWRSSIARKLRREKDCRCLGVRGLTSWLPTKHTWDCSYFLRRAHRLFPRLSPATSAPSIMSSGNNTQFKSLEEWARALSAPPQALPPPFRGGGCWRSGLHASFFPVRRLGVHLREHSVVSLLGLVLLVFRLRCSRLEVFPGGLKLMEAARATRPLSGWV